MSDHIILLNCLINTLIITVSLYLFKTKWQLLK